MPSFFLFRKRAASALSNDGRSRSTAISNDIATHIKNNKNNKRKKLSTKSTQALDSKASCEYGDVSNNRRQLDNSHDGDAEPLYISSILLELSEGERSTLLRYIDDAGINSKCQHLLDQQDSYQGGHGQEINTEVDGIAHSGLVEHYERLGDIGLATLQKDIATCRLQISNTDTDTNEDESLAAAEGDINNTTQNDEKNIRFDCGGDEGGLGELRTDIPADGTPLKLDRAPNGVESGEQSADVFAVVGDGDIAQDDGDFSFDIGSNESINDGLGTTPTDASSSPTNNTSPTIGEEVGDSDNAPSTTSNLKLDGIKYVERVDNKRTDPSPTNVTANLSSFTNERGPEDKELLTFDDSPTKNVVESSVKVSPRKGKAMCFVYCIL